MAFALVAGRRVIVHRGFELLKSNFEKYFWPHRNSRDYKEYFKLPLSAFGMQESGDSHIERLHQLFSLGPSRELTAAELIDHISETVHASGPIGFPGLPHDLTASDSFRLALQELAS